MMINRGISGYAGIPFWTICVIIEQLNCEHLNSLCFLMTWILLRMKRKLEVNSSSQETQKLKRTSLSKLGETFKVGVPHQLCFVHLKVILLCNLLCSVCSVPLFHRLMRGKSWAPCENSTRHLALLSHRKMYQLPWSPSSASASVISHLPSCSASHWLCYSARSPRENWRNSARNSSRC